MYSLVLMPRFDTAATFLRLGVTLVIPALAASLALGCGSDGDSTNADTANEGPSNAEDDGEAMTTSGGPGDDDGTPDEGEGEGDDSGVGASTGADEGESGSVDGFIMNPDGMGTNNECDIWTQDCPKGEKCMPWANDGGNSWNATRCSEVADTPDQPGDTCTVEGGGVSGLDSCDIASMCWGVDGDTNEGVCAAFCEGDASNPVCSDPETGCSTSNDGVLILCLPYCDPLLQDCAEGEACYPEAIGFICSPDASGADSGLYGDGCAFLNGCDPGLYCADASGVPGCEAASCCSAFCDVEEANECPGAAEGQMCVPFWEDGEAPPGQEAYGLCFIEA